MWPSLPYSLSKFLQNVMRFEAGRISLGCPPTQAQRWWWMLPQGSREVLTPPALWPLGIPRASLSPSGPRSLSSFLPLCRCRMRVAVRMCLQSTGLLRCQAIVHLDPAQVSLGSTLRAVVTSPQSAAGAKSWPKCPVQERGWRE